MRQTGQEGAEEVAGQRRRRGQGCRGGGGGRRGQEGTEGQDGLWEGRPAGLGISGCVSRRSPGDPQAVCRHRGRCGLCFEGSAARLASLSLGPTPVQAGLRSSMVGPGHFVLRSGRAQWACGWAVGRALEGAQG